MPSTRFLASALVLVATVALGGCDSDVTPDDRDAGSLPTRDASPGDASFLDASPHDASRARSDGDAPSPCDTDPGPCGVGNGCEPDDEGGFVCTCTPPLAGERCEVVDGCAGTPCANGGTCAPDDERGYVCTCAAGFSGPTCETIDVPCPSVNPCLNGGTCVDGVGAYTCDCLEGFGADDCSVACGTASTGATAVADGDWTAAATWGGVVPSSGTFVTIPEGTTVTIPAGAAVRSFRCATVTVTGTLVNRGELIIDGTLVLRGPDPATPATFTNEGTLVLRHTLTTGAAEGPSAFVNASGGTITSHGTFGLHRFTNEGTWTVASGTVECTSRDSCAFLNAGTMTLAAGATFDANVSAGESATNTGTLVNHGHIDTSRRFENRGTLTNTGTLDTYTDAAVSCGFTNAAAATLVNAGGIRLHCQLTNAGTITNTGSMQVNADRGRLLNEGTLTNEVGGAIESYGALDNAGTFVNRGDLDLHAADIGMTNTGTLTTHGMLTVGGRFRMLAGGTVIIAVGGSLETSVGVGNWGTLDIYGSLTTWAPEGGLSNSGTAHERCGSTVLRASGAPGWTGTPAIVEAPCP
ncbi:calcium-binding EGF-like domain-containing protein [Sandaracinus amylolyticus]|uniref:Outer membrane autotransporter barrel domain protein n=1 Tax=Sandaracinus amylolyticus TaxID=927083 RepID=A0A0F6W3U4_9BACT|nr:calcium-binding EGF-like domain-containing protein [Sandaracinus amylolyticus]AKF06775.1 outer membrane autotransporter barrel domain protein [Sandaracinus amylolyticus]